MDHRKILRGLAAGVLALALTGTAAAQGVKIKMTSTWPSGINLIEADKYFVQTVNKLGGGKVQIEFYEGGALVPSTQVFDATASGTLDASADWPGYWAGQNPAFALLGSYPMLLTSGDYMLWLQQWGGFEAFQDVYGQFGMVYLPYASLPMESGLRFRSQITTLEQMKGKRLRMSGRPQGEILKALGAVQVQLPGGEVYQALERGVVEGAEFSAPGVDWGMGLQEVTKHWQVPGWHQPGTILGVMINKKAWDKLGADNQTLLRLAADATMTWSFGFFNKDSVEASRKFQDKGTQIHKLSQAEMERLQQIANEVLVKESCENKLFAKVALSQVRFMQDYSEWRDLQGDFAFGRNPVMPDVKKIEECAK